MDIATQVFFSGMISDDQWQPFVYPQDGKSHTHGEFVPFRETGTGGELLAVGLWRCKPLEIRQCTAQNWETKPF